MDKKARAKLLLLEVKAIQDGDYANRTSDLLFMVNEVIRDAQVLAEETIQSESDESGLKKAA